MYGDKSTQYLSQCIHTSMFKAQVVLITCFVLILKLFW